MRNYLLCACDAKVWGFAALFGLTTTVTYAIAYFLPIILKDGMGFSTAEAQCLISPPYVAAAIWMFTCAYFGDKYRIRAPFIIFNAVLGIVGLALLGFTENNGSRYLGVFFATISANSNIPCILTYQANNSKFNLCNNSYRTRWLTSSSPRSMEACSLLRNTRRHGRHWWHCGYDRLPPGGQAILQARHVRHHSGVVFDRRHHASSYVEVSPGEQARCGWWQDH